MKTGTALLLIFVLWFGWTRYAEHEAARQKEATERWQGYERCIDYPYSASPEVQQVQQQARHDCATFWLNGRMPTGEANPKVWAK